jgi:hypothetical protein
VWPALNRLLPPLRWWRVPGRIWFVAALIGPYLAGWGAQLAIDSPPRSRRARLTLTGVIGGGLALAAASAALLRPTIGMGPVIGLLALPFTALALLLAGRLPARRLLIALLVIVLADLVWIDRTLVEGRPEDEWLTPYAPLAEVLHEDGAIRVYSPSYSLPQSAAAYWDIPQFGGVDPFQSRAYAAAFAAASGIPGEGYSVTLPTYDVGALAPGESEADILARANAGAPLDAARLGEWLVTHVVAAFPVEADGLVLLKEMQVAGRRVYVYRNTRVPAVTLDWEGPNRVTIRAAEPLTGSLYAVAGGRWQGVEGVAPGLPGPVNGSATTWTYAYSAAEVWITGAVSAGLILCAGLILRRTR